MTVVSQAQLALIEALKAEKKANESAQKVQSEYDIKLAAFHEENKGLVEELYEVNRIKATRKELARKSKEIATSILNDVFIDDLPEGFIQKKTTDIVYDERDMRRAALVHFHHLLVLDKKAVDKFIKDNVTESKKTKGYLIVPDSIRDFVIVDAYYKPLPNISTAKLLKLDVSPVVE